MVKKRAHKKSRNGCDQCKRRRVKCDEGGPPCDNCISRAIKCHYTSRASSHDVDSGVHSSSNPQNSAPPGAQPGQAAVSDTGASDIPLPLPTRTKELELMHHWCIKTCQSFTVRLANLFQGYVVQEAIKHEYLMESILALTSLHIASEMDDAISASSYVSAGLQYQNNAVHTFHTALQNITPSNCDAVFAASILTMACTIVSPVLSAGNNDRTKAPLESYLILFDFVKGISSITNTSRQWLETGPFGEIFWPDAKHVRDGQIIPSIMLLRNLNDTVNGNTNLDLHEVYQHSIGQLEKCVAIDKHTVIRWLGMVGKNFMNELRDKSPMALIIFMYWGVILDQLEELWWAKCLGKRLVEELSDSISGCGKEWDEAIRWATEQVGCNSPETDRSLGN